MNSDLIPRIIRGEKTATTRRGQKDYHPGPAMVVDNQSGVMVPVVIVRLKYISYHFLDDAIAKVEGYETATELKEALTKIYGPIPANEVMTVIFFRLAPKT